MAGKIYYDFDVCQKCSDKLQKLYQEWENDRPMVPVVEGNGIFVEQVKDIMDVLESLHVSFGLLAETTGAFIREASMSMKQLDDHFAQDSIKIKEKANEK